jgi:hypothetical protein
MRLEQQRVIAAGEHPYYRGVGPFRFKWVPWVWIYIIGAGRLLCLLMSNIESRRLPHKV